MTQIKIIKIDTGFILENSNGRLELSWADFNDIAKYSDYQDALNEVEDYLDGYDEESCEELYGMKPDDITGDTDLMAQIVDALISIRINNETTDEIYDAMEFMRK